MTIEQAEALYKGFLKDIHEFFYYTSNGSMMSGCKFTLNMPKQVSEDMANVMVGEYIKIESDDENIKQIFNQDFFMSIRIFIEKYLATGQGLILPYVYDGDIYFNFFTGTEFKVTDWKNKKVHKLKIKQDKYDIILEQEKGFYTISYEYDEKYKGEKVEPYQLEGDINYFKPNKANQNHENEGASIYAESLNLLDAIDSAFTDSEIEFNLSKKRVFISRNMLKTEEVNKDGNVSYETMFDPNETLYQMLFDDDSEKEHLKEYGGEIRVEAYHERINYLLKLLGDKTGLDDYYIIENGVIRTKAEVINDKQKLYRNRKNHLNLFISELDKLIESTYTFIGDIPEYNVVVDDSIITDSQLDQQNAIKEFEVGLMSSEYYLKNIKKLTEDDLQRELELLADVDDLVPPDGRSVL